MLYVKLAKTTVSTSITRLTLLLAMIVVVVSLAGGDGTGGLEWNTL